MENPSRTSFGKSHDIHNADGRCLDGFDGVVLIGDRRGGAGQIINLIRFHIERMNNVVSNQFKSGMTDQMANIVFATCEKIIDADDFISTFDQSVAQVTSKKSGTACHQNSFHRSNRFHQRAK
jgi:hypothetical protein